MKKKKNIYYIFILMLICLSALAACGQPETSRPDSPEYSIGKKQQIYRYKRIRTVRIAEEISGVKIIQTGFSEPEGEVTSVRLELAWNRDGQRGDQIILLDRMNSPLTADMSNCRAWDGNDDGYEDILYYAGYTAGSGGVWYLYDLLCWSEEKQEYVSVELPECDYINYEDHTLHSLVADGAGREYYTIYGLRDGKYQVEKALSCVYGMPDTAEMVLTVTYSENGEVVETTDLSPAPDWEEAMSLLKEQYPEFIYWWKD